MAHRELETLVLEPVLAELKRGISRAYADVVHSGLWSSHTREALDAFVADVQRRVSGSVRLELFKGDCRVTGRRTTTANDAGLHAARVVRE